MSNGQAILDAEVATGTATVDANKIEMDRGVTAVESVNIWHNAANPYDVGNDGTVMPIDALLVVNYLNAHGSGPVPVGNPSPYLDVNGDNSVSPIDALMVINILNARGAGEGEGLAVLAQANDGGTTTNIQMASLAVDRILAASVDTTGGTVKKQSTILAANHNAPTATKANQLARDDRSGVTSDFDPMRVPASTESIDDFFSELGSALMLSARGSLAQMGFA